MGAATNNNKRVKRAIAEVLFDHGPCTREEVAEHLSKMRSVRTLPSPNSLSALLSKNPQVVCVGVVKTRTDTNVTTKHQQFDINREIVWDREDLIHTRPPSFMTPAERDKALVCPSCARKRIMPAGQTTCLDCLRAIE